LSLAMESIPSISLTIRALKNSHLSKPFSGPPRKISASQTCMTLVLNS